MRTLLTNEIFVVSGGADANDLPADVIEAIQKKGLWAAFVAAVGTLGAYRDMFEFANYVISGALSSIPRQDLQWGPAYNGLGSPGDGTVPGDAFAGASAGGHLIIDDRAAGGSGTP